MDDIKLYEKVKQYKREGLEDSAIIMRLVDKETSTLSILQELDEYHKMEQSREWLSNWAKNVKKVKKCDEYGIPMIDKDEDW